MEYSKVDGHSNLIRDESTKAIINTNLSEYQNYIIEKDIDEKGKSFEIRWTLIWYLQ
jgi:hypothetical protein